MRYITCLIGAFALVGLVGCATNAVTGRQQLSIVPESMVIAEEAAAYNSEIRNLRSLGRIVTDAVVVNRVRDITNPLIQQAIAYRADTRSWNWEVQIIKESEANALCGAGGKMMIFTGLLQGLDLTDDELAQVMAHEISHALLSHAAEKRSVRWLGELVSAAVEANGRTALDREFRRLSTDTATKYAWRLPNSRQAEAEADSVGIEIAAKAGFDPNAAITFHQKLSAHHGSSQSRSDWRKTHPAEPKRIDALAARVESLQPLYLAALNSRGQAQRSHQPAATASNPVGLASAGAAPVSFQDRCNSTSQVDRAACLGQIGIGMHKYDIYQALGSPTEQDSTGAVLRYSDRFLQLDSRDRLTQILDHRPQLPKPVVQTGQQEVLVID